MGMTERFVETPNGRVRYVTTGNGPGILLLHGSAQWADSWNEQAELVDQLAPDFRVVAVDRPGHGPRSPSVPASALREQAVVEGLVAVLDAEGLTQVAVWGYSLGGHTALSLATMYPDRVLAIVQMSSPPFDEGRLRHFYSTVAAMADSVGLRGVLKTLGLDGGPDVDAAIEHVGDVTWRDAVLGAITFQPDPGAISVPWLYAYGSDEAPAPAGDDLALVSGAGGVVHMVGGADHVGMFSRTAEVLEVARPVLGLN